jgi:hypothetical protein
VLFCRNRPYFSTWVQRKKLYTISLVIITSILLYERTTCSFLKIVPKKVLRQNSFFSDDSIYFEQITLYTIRWKESIIGSLKLHYFNILVSTKIN